MALVEARITAPRRQHGVSGRIAADNRVVLPRLPHWAIAEALRRLPAEDIAAVLRSRILPVASLPGLHLYACFSRAAEAHARRIGLNLVAAGSSADFLAAARQTVAPRLLRDASHALARRHAHF